MAAKPQKTLADYLTIAISPVLIMALIGSLVFFLIDVVYKGDYSGRMQWIFFFFIFASVLITRLAMTGESSIPPAAYGAVLGIVSLVVLAQFAEFGKSTPLAAFSWLINAALLGLVWWCANKLTWDCTLVEDEQDASGEGLLQAAGLDDEPAIVEAATPTPEDEDAEAVTDVKAAREEPLSWWDRKVLAGESEKRKPKKAKPPGTWVVYFSLAALPLFGLGQILARTASAERRRYIFWLMAIYVASGLGLLLTTSFLGLRRYLRQRKLQMPVAMSGMWVTVGALMVLALMTMAWIIPRPNPEYSVAQMTDKFLGSKERDASKNAVRRDSPGKGQGASSPESRPGQKPENGDGGQRDKQGNKTKAGKDDTQGGSGKDQQGNKGQQQDKQGNSGQSNQQNSKSNDGQAGKKEDEQKKKDRAVAGKDDQSKSKDKTQGDSKSEQSDDASSGEKNDEDSSNPESNSDSSEAVSKIGQIVQWILIALGVLVGLFFLIRNWKEFVAWLKGLWEALLNFWASLFGGQKKEKEEAENIGEEFTPTPRPFAEFQNPFVHGGYENLEELVRYSFEALQAWAFENDLARQPQETPLEFVERLSNDVGRLSHDARRLAGYYVQVVYAAADAGIVRGTAQRVLANPHFHFHASRS